LATNTNILFPQTPFIDPSTGRPSLPWVLWLQNPSFVSATYANALAISSGGTGISTAPTNGQLLIGNAGNYTLHTLSTGSGIGITNGAGLITVANTGVLSNIASSGISVSGATGNVTIANTGVLSAIAGSGISVSGATGNVTFANTGVLSFSGGSTGLTPVTATTGAVSLAGTLAVAYGGTGQTTYTDGQLLIGNTTGNTLAKSTLTAGTGISITNGSGSITVTNTSPSSGGTVTSVSVVSANGLAGTVATATTTPAITLSTTITGLLKGNGTAISAATSGTDYAPATSGTSILYGNGSGGFSNVTIGTGVSFAAGTLSATGSGGTVTSVAALTLGTTGTDLSSTVANGTTTPVITLNVPTASATNRGALSSADWTTFNNKGSGSVTSVSGTGTVNGITLTGTVTSSGSLTLGGTLGSIANSQLSNSTISGVSLGGNLFSLTAGTGVSFSAGTTYNGSTAITITATGSGGTVTSVTGTAPVVSSGGTTPAISMAKATTSVDGYLSSTDWTTFNNKGSGTVTSVAALTLGTTGTDLSSTVANGTTTPVITLQVPTASASNRGALSAADWTTFNNKGSGSVTSVAQSFTGGLISVAGSPITTSGTLALTVAGTSGGIPYFSSGTTWATSAALAAGSLMQGGGAGVAPSTITTGTGVVTALGVNTGTAGAFVVNGGALGTPSSGTVTNLTGTASININGTVGATTKNTGAFTTISAVKATAGDVASFTNAAASNKTAFIYTDNIYIAFMNIGGAGAGDGWLIGNSNIYAQIGGSTKATISGTGVAVTGVLSATGVVTFSNYGVGTATFNGSGVISSVSDETWKIKDGAPVNADAMLNKLEPGYWYYNDDKKETFGTDRQLGFYAQNVNAAIGPEAAPKPEEGKPWGYYDRSILAVTVMSLQKALATIELLTEKVNRLEKL